jgi:hypothetical protein
MKIIEMVKMWRGGGDKYIGKRQALFSVVLIGFTPPPPNYTKARMSAIRTSLLVFLLSASQVDFS